MKMKKMNLFLGMAILALLFTSCASSVQTTYIGDTYAESAAHITFLNRAYIERNKIPLTVPSGIRENLLGGPLPFVVNMLVKPGQTGQDIKSKVKEAIQADFEQMIQNMHRFGNIGQYRFARADREVFEDQRKGKVNIADKEPFKQIQNEGIIEVVVYPSQSATRDPQNKRQRMTQYRQEWNIRVTDGNSQPNKDYDPVKESLEKIVYTEVDASGRPIGAVGDFDQAHHSFVQREVGKLGQLRFIDYVYKTFPAGGSVKAFSPSFTTVAIKGGEASGVLPNMEMVIYAKDESGLRYALFNATATTTMAEESQLTIWREATDPDARAIIQQLKANRAATMKAYEFYAASNGIPEHPRFIVVGQD